MVKITTKQFAIVNELEVDEPKIGMELGFNVTPSFKMQRLGVSSILKLVDEKALKLLILELFCEFEIHPEDWKKMLNEKQIVIPKDFIIYLISQSVGTLRGVLYCKTEDTSFSKFVLPPVNVSEIVKTDASFDLE